MKKIFAIAAVVFVSFGIFLSCGNSGEKSSLRTGDLVFVKIPAGYDLYSESMPDTTGGYITIHVAVLEVSKDSTWIIDATIKHGVDRHPLDTFLTDFTLKDGSLPRFEIMRPTVNAEQAEQFVANVKKFLGTPYDCSFKPGNDSLYCSELVRNSYVLSSEEPIFSEYSMDFNNRDGEMPIYWTQLFGILGSDVPQGVSGTTPAQMAQEDVLTPVCIGFPRLESDKSDEDDYTEDFILL